MKSVSGSMKGAAYSLAAVCLAISGVGCTWRGMEWDPSDAAMPIDRPMPVAVVLEPLKFARQDFMYEQETGPPKSVPSPDDFRWASAETFDTLVESYLSQAGLFQGGVLRDSPDRVIRDFTTLRPTLTVEQHIRPSPAGTALSLMTIGAYNLLGFSADDRSAKCVLEVSVVSPSGRPIGGSFSTSRRSAIRLATEAGDQLGPLVKFALRGTLENFTTQINSRSDLLMEALAADLMSIEGEQMEIHPHYPMEVILHAQRIQMTGQVIGVDRPVILEWQINDAENGTALLKDTTTESVKGFSIDAEVPVGKVKVVLTLREPEGEQGLPVMLAKTKVGYLCRPEVAPPAIEVQDRWAVVIGIRDYAYDGGFFKDLKYADNDANAFAEFLGSSRSPGGGQTHILKLTNHEATAEEMRYALFEYLGQAEENDLVIIFFSGHGARDPGTGNDFLLCYDTNPERLPSTAFPMWDISTALRRYIKAQHIIVLADACHSGSISSPPGGKDLAYNPSHHALHTIAFGQPGRLFFTASEADEISVESEDYSGGRGVFTHFLLTGLKGAADENDDRTITVGELIDYVQDEVEEATNGSQHPYPSGQYSRNLPMSRLD